MKKGPSLYYASDKNVYDALNQPKVDSQTIQNIFVRRNVICSKSTRREDLSLFFSRMTHDLIDHKDLSDKLGIVPRRERITVVDLIGPPPSVDCLTLVVDRMREQMAKQGDVLQVNRDGKTLNLNIRYSLIDFRRSEFSQVQQRSGFIELIEEKHRVVIRSSKNDYIDEIRDEVIRQIIKECNNTLSRKEVSLFHYIDPLVRSKFFYDLITDLPGYSRRDVTDVFVYKPRPADSEDIGDDESVSDPHIDRIALRGSGISQSDIFRNLTQEKSYYIAKVSWLCVANMGTGAGYQLEATFADPKECTGFSYILRGVYDLGENSKLVKVRRSPTSDEIDRMARLLENKARELMLALETGGGDAES